MYFESCGDVLINLFYQLDFLLLLKEMDLFILLRRISSGLYMSDVLPFVVEITFLYSCQNHLHVREEFLSFLLYSGVLYLHANSISG